MRPFLAIIVLACLVALCRCQPGNMTNQEAHEALVNRNIIIFGNKAEVQKAEEDLKRYEVSYWVASDLEQAVMMADHEFVELHCEGLPAQVIQAVKADYLLSQNLGFKAKCRSFGMLFVRLDSRTTDSPTMYLAAP
jgi:hypothetical protein